MIPLLRRVNSRAGSVWCSAYSTVRGITGNNSQDLFQRRNEYAWNVYKTRFGNAKYVMAPMVDQSELAFRMLVRKYTPDILCYTPMIHSFNFFSSEKYREENFTTNPQDRPLIAQFCANDPDILLNAARLIEDKVDAIDLNLGCPQSIARRGHYGAFLMDEPELVYKLLSNLVKNLSVPVTCKCRIYDDWERTKEWVQMLESTGIVCLAVHGRTRDQKPNSKFRADWNSIRRVKEILSIPIIANGNIRHLDDVDECIQITGASGVMSAESLLENPALFSREVVSPSEMAKEYLKISSECFTPLRMVRAHIFQILNSSLSKHVDIREELRASTTIEDYLSVVERIESREEKE